MSISNITMSGFTFVTNIEVCCQKPDNVAKFEPEFDVRVLDFPDPNDRGDKGAQCTAISAGKMAKANVIKDASAKSEVSCQTYTCAGTNVTAFMGQYITVRSLNEDGDEPTIVDVQAIGTSANCPYYAFFGRSR